MDDVENRKHLIDSGATFEQCLNRGEPFQQQFAISDEVMQLKFEAACTYYREEKYQEASEVFAHLALLNPFKKSYWISLAASQTHLAHYEEALKSYLCAAVADPKDPAPHLYSVYCHLKQDCPSDASAALKVALELAKRDTAFSILEEQAREMASRLFPKDRFE